MEAYEGCTLRLFADLLSLNAYSFPLPGSIIYACITLISETQRSVSISAPASNVTVAEQFTFDARFGSEWSLTAIKSFLERESLLVEIIQEWQDNGKKATFTLGSYKAPLLAILFENGNLSKPKREFLDLELTCTDSPRVQLPPSKLRINLSTFLLGLPLSSPSVSSSRSPTSFRRSSGRLPLSNSQEEASISPADLETAVSSLSKQREDKDEVNMEDLPVSSNIALPKPQPSQRSAHPSSSPSVSSHASRRLSVVTVAGISSPPLEEPFAFDSELVQESPFSAVHNSLLLTSRSDSSADTTFYDQSPAARLGSSSSLASSTFSSRQRTRSKSPTASSRSWKPAGHGIPSAIPGRRSPVFENAPLSSGTRVAKPSKSSTTPLKSQSRKLKTQSKECEVCEPVSVPVADASSSSSSDTVFLKSVVSQASSRLSSLIKSYVVEPSPIDTFDSIPQEQSSLDMDTIADNARKLLEQRKNAFLQSIEISRGKHLPPPPAPPMPKSERAKFEEELTKIRTHVYDPMRLAPPPAPQPAPRCEGMLFNTYLDFLTAKTNPPKFRRATTRHTPKKIQTK